MPSLKDALQQDMPYVLFDEFPSHETGETVIIAARRVGKEVVRVKKFITEKMLVSADPKSLVKSIRRELIYAMAEHIITTKPDAFHTINVYGAEFDEDGMEISLIKQYPTDNDVPPYEDRHYETLHDLEPVDPSFGSW